ncbi:MAG: hypothetical protein ABI255_04255 [Microbacteriaceae bacterium]
MRQLPYEISRRSAIRVGFLALVGATLPQLSDIARLSGAGQPSVRERVAMADPAKQAPRYLFTCQSPLPNVGAFTTIEDVWSSPAYMTIDSCVVSYIGAGPFVLTDAESWIVSVAENAGMTVTDRPALYLTILSACTRIRSSELAARLAALGAPVVRAALAREPEAPQAKLLSAWLDAQG